MRLKQIVIVGCLGILLLLSGCSEKGKETVTKDAGTDIFSYVPSDSPYVMGNTKSVPKPYLVKMIDLWQEILPQQAELMKNQQPSADTKAEKTAIHFAQALLEELSAIKTPEDIESQWGLPTKGTSVFYGLGLMPVVRIEHLDRAKVEQLLDRLEEKSGEKMSTAELDGQSYRLIDLKDDIHLKAILAVTENHLVAGVMPGDQTGTDTFLPLILGTSKPESAMSQSDFKAKLSVYQYPGYGDGYIDIQKIAAILRGEGEGLQTASLKAFAPESNEPLQIGCNTEFNRTFFANIPRLVFGIQTLSEQEAAMEMILELSDTLVETFKKLPQSVPDIKGATDPMFAVGFGANIPELRMSIQRLIQFIIDNNQDCPKLNTAKLKEVLPKLNMALNPMISGLQSLVISLDNLETDDNGKPNMDTAAACVALEMNDPMGLVAMGASFVPSLANLNIPPDGTPVAVPLEGIPLPIPTIFSAIKEKRLVLAMGKEAQIRAKGAIAGGAINAKPLFWISYQSAIWEEALKSGFKTSKQMKKADQKALLDMFDQYKEMFKGIEGGVYVTDNGLSFQERVTLH